LHTTFIGIRKPFSISNTPTAVAGSKRFLLSTGVSTRANEFVNFVRSLRLRYASLARRDRAKFVLQRHHSLPAHRFVPVTLLPSHHFNASFAHFTRINVTRSTRTSPQSMLFLTNWLRRNVYSHSYVTTVQRGRATDPFQQVHAHTIHGDHDHRSTVLTRLHTERIEQRSHVSRLEHTLAREIAFRLRRVEQMPQSRSVVHETRVLPARTMQVVHHPSIFAPSSPHPSQEFRPALSAPPPASLNLDAVAQSVMRHIDNRLSARRERLGRV
jgi:hypothetical protein